MFFKILSVSDLLDIMLKFVAILTRMGACAWCACSSIKFSYAQVTDAVFDSCDLSDHPLHVWGLPSVDNSVSIQGLDPGDFYYLCAVAGHCDAGMKIKVCEVI